MAQISQMLRGVMAQEFSVVFGVRGGTEVGPYIKTSHARNHRAASVKSVQSVRKVLSKRIAGRISRHSPRKKRYYKNMI